MFKLCLHNNLNNKLYIYFFFFAWSAGENRSTDLRRADGWPLTQSRSHLWGNLLEMDCPFSSDLPGGWKIGSLSFGILRQDQNGWRRVSADIRCSIGEIWGSDQVCLKKKRTCGPDQTAHVKGPLFAVLLFPRSSVWSQDRTATVRHRQSKVYVNPKSLY